MFRKWKVFVTCRIFLFSLVDTHNSDVEFMPNASLGKISALAYPHAPRLINTGATRPHRLVF